MYLLDTQTCVRFLDGSDDSVAGKMRSTPPAEISLCSLVKAELLQRARQSTRVEENLELLERFFSPIGSLPFDDRCAEEYGLIRSQLGEQAEETAQADLMLAAMARAHDAILVARNAGPLRKIAGLRVADWSA
ncbi:MAG: type II toxin-antitoxin system VapC family toxin [Thiogranum sp.]